MLHSLICAVLLALQLPSAAAPSEGFDVGTLHVERYGNGATPLILVPGLASGAWEWRGTVAQFAANHTVYVLTLPGFDGRPASTQAPLFAGFARDFWTLLDTRKIDRPVVIGHSLGGTLAIALAETHPERLRGIVAVDGLPVFPTAAGMTPEQRATAAKTLSASVAAESQADFAAYEVRYMQQVGTLDAQLAPQLGELAARSDRGAVAAWIAEDLTTDLRPQLGHITIPFVEMMPYASPSPYTQAQTQAFYESLVAGAPHVRVVPIAPSRHFAMLDQPAAFNAEITRFLDAVK